MAEIFVSGKVGSVLVGTIAYPFKDWSLSMEAKQLETSNFTTGG